MKLVIVSILFVCSSVSCFSHDRYDTTARDPNREDVAATAQQAPSHGGKSQAPATKDQPKKPPPPGLGSKKHEHVTEEAEPETESPQATTTEKSVDEKGNADKLNKKIDQTLKVVKQVAKKVDKAASLQKDMERLQSTMKKKKDEPLDDDDEDEKKPDDTFDQLNKKFATFLESVLSLSTDSKLPEVAEFIRAETKHLMWLDTAGHAIEEVIPHLSKIKKPAEEAETWRAKIPEGESTEKRISRLENVIDMADIKVTDMKSNLDLAIKYFGYYKDFYVKKEKE